MWLINIQSCNKPHSKQDASQLFSNLSLCAVHICPDPTRHTLLYHTIPFYTIPYHAILMWNTIAYYTYVWNTMLWPHPLIPWLSSINLRHSQHLPCIQPSQPLQSGKDWAKQIYSFNTNMKLLHLGRQNRGLRKVIAGQLFGLFSPASSESTSSKRTITLTTDDI